MFNNLAQLPYAAYNILMYLVNNNEIIWKMLKYNDYDALSKPNLSISEKLDFVWKFGKQEKFSVFLTGLVEDAIAESKSILKIYQYYIHAKPNSYISTAVFAFDFLYGGNMALINYEGVPVSRGDLFVNQILDTLNGVDIGGVGTLVFNDDLSRYISERYVIGNNKTYTGNCLYMGVLMGSLDEECYEP